MSTTAEHIDLLLEDQGLHAFKKSGLDDCWIIPYETFYIQLFLREEGEYVWFRGSQLADLDELPVQERPRVLEHFMRLNGRIKLGRFCGYPQIAFEVGLPVEDGELTAAQFGRCLNITANKTAAERYTPRSQDGTGELQLRLPGHPELN